MNTNPRPTRQTALTKTGFTLIELLVVISIISMLMSIMLPGLNNAQEMGRRVVCLSNMRQLGIAWMLYAHENDDSLCSPDTDFNSADSQNNRWVADGHDLNPNTNAIGGTVEAIKNGALYGYVSETANVYKCKSDKTELLRSYSISNTMGGYNCGCSNITASYYSLSEIRSPSNKLVFIDTDSILPDGDRKWISDAFWPIHWSNQAWDAKIYNNITARHGDGTNMTFADSHAGYRKWRDYQTVEIAKWNSFYYNSSDGRRDLELLCEIMKGPND
ncbi:MAG: type II secretion system protein [Sedimentisphaerales bacterium]|nr:type II secretion system protein [Sedimentisphaerales bacterium]